jgi:hypothetical protein
MIGLLCFVLTALASPFKSKLRLQAENAVFRHQLNALRRRLQGRLRLTNNDRWFLIRLHRWFPSILKVVTIVQRDTLVRWYRAGFLRYCRLEIELAGRAPASRDRIARADSADEHGEPVRRQHRVTNK